MSECPGRGSFGIALQAALYRGHVSVYTMSERNGSREYVVAVSLNSRVTLCFLVLSPTTANLPPPTCIYYYQRILYEQKKLEID